MNQHEANDRRKAKKCVDIFAVHCGFTGAHGITEPEYNHEI
jgi:hypothetical protein